MNAMDTTVNKKVIGNLYENVLNNREFELLDSLVSKDYKNTQGEKGIEAFKKGIVAITKAFPDAKWTVTEIVAEGNKVFVKQHVKGTHKEQFQNIAATGRSISNEGTAIYEFKEGKIISHQIQTDRLGFLQQLGVLPNDVAGPSQEKDYVYFVDKFSIPKNAIEEFTRKMHYNRNLIKSLHGFIKDEAIAYRDTTGDLTLMTIAIWQNQECLDKAKMLVQADYEKIHFSPGEFTQRLNIKMERQLYKAYPD
jgi:steroid delta-isomerase-like uncharacterized protein